MTKQELNDKLTEISKLDRKQIIEHLESLIEEKEIVGYSSFSDGINVYGKGITNVIFSFDMY